MSSNGTETYDKDETAADRRGVGGLCASPILFCGKHFGR